MKKFILAAFTLIWCNSALAGNTNCDTSSMDDLSKQLYQRAQAAWCLKGQDTAEHVGELFRWIETGKATWHSGNMLNSTSKYTAHLLAGFRITNYMMLKIGNERFAIIEMDAPDKTRPVFRAQAVYKIDPSLKEWAFQVVEK